eukprot:8838368-Pyramimonas_sp.AAC.2
MLLRTRGAFEAAGVTSCRKVRTPTTKKGVVARGLCDWSIRRKRDTQWSPLWIGPRHKWCRFQRPRINNTQGADSCAQGVNSCVQGVD